VRVLSGYFFTKRNGIVPVPPDHLAVINLAPKTYFNNFDRSIEENADLRGYMFLIEGEDKDDS